MKDNEITPAWTRWLLAVILLAGLAARIAGAWYGRVITDPDASVVALMAKHMALGLEFPCFFYGQLYMGSFEPAVSALLCKIFGVSGFMVNLGTALVAVWLLPVVYVWGRDAGGRVAGLAAAAFCISGSPVFIQYQFNPRGGYATVIVLGALVVWLAARIAARREDIHRSQILLLGLIAGFAWWVDPLIVMALLAASLVLFIGLRWSVFKPGFWLPGLAGFFIGGSPFWIWNARHEWAGVTALFESERRVFSEGSFDFLNRAQRAVGLVDISPVLWWMTLSVFIAAVLVALYRLATSVKFRRADLPTMSTLAAVMMLVCAYFIFSNSTFSRENTARYLLPMVPALAILFGLLVSACARWHKALVLVPVAVIAVMQIRTPPVYVRREAHVEAMRRIVPALHELLPAHGIRNVYIDFILYPLNFHTDEAYGFPLLLGERCPFIAEAVENDPSPAFMNVHKELRHFIDTAGGTSTRIAFGTASLLHDVRPLPEAWKPISRDAIVSGAMSSEENAGVATLTDGQRGSYWFYRRKPDQREYAEVRFREPTTISGLRMVCPEKSLTPVFWSIEGQTEDGAWKVLVPDKLIAGFYWSGPRAYTGGHFVRHDARFDAEKLTALRIVFPPGEQPPRWGISELCFFEPVTETWDESAEQVDKVMMFLRERGITNVYADRWMANQIWSRSDKTIRTSRELPEYSGQQERENPLIIWTYGTAMLVRKDGVDLTRVVLKDAGVTAVETPVGPWILFDDFHGSATNVEWAGFSALRR